MLDQSFLGEKYYDISNVAEQFAPGGTFGSTQTNRDIAKYQKSSSLQFLRSLHIMTLSSFADKDHVDDHHDRNLDYDDVQRRR